MPTGSIIHYFWLSIAMGGLSLLTPCVFPMVPITVSYFTNHSSRTRGDAIKAAGLYALGIMFTFVALGMSLAINSWRFGDQQVGLKSVGQPPHHGNLLELCS